MLRTSSELLTILAKVRQLKTEDSTLTEEEKLTLAEEISAYANECQSLAVDNLMGEMFEDTLGSNEEYQTLLIMLVSFIAPMELLLRPTHAIDRTLKNFVGIALREGWISVS